MNLQNYNVFEIIIANVSEEYKKRKFVINRFVSNVLLVTLCIYYFIFYKIFN